MRVTTSVTGDTTGFDGLRAVVGAGEGVVGRFPGIVCVAHCSDPEPLRAFLAMCADVAGREPGRVLARRLATWMSGPEAPGPQLRFGTIATTGDQLAVYLVGDVDARVDAVGGLALSGAHAAIGTDRLLPHPAAAIVLSLNGGEVRADPADVHDLRAGVVPGAGVVLRPAGFGVRGHDHADEAAAAGHEWFDTGEATSDPFAGPPLAQGVPAQRAAGTGVGGRNGAAQAAEPEATAAGGEPSATANGGSANGRDPAPTDGSRTASRTGPTNSPSAAPTDGTGGHLDTWPDPGPVATPPHEPSAAWMDRPDPGPRPYAWLDDEPEAEPIDWGEADPGIDTPAGRHALEAPIAPVEEQTTRDAPTEPQADALGDPLSSDDPADHLGADPEWPDPRGDGSHALAPRAVDEWTADPGADGGPAAAPSAPAGLQDETDARPRADTPLPGPTFGDSPAEGGAPTGRDATNGAPPEAGSGVVGPSSVDGLPVRSRSATALAWPAEPTSARWSGQWPVQSSGHSSGHSSVPPSEASLFAPAREASRAPAPGSAADPLAGPAAPDPSAGPPPFPLFEAASEAPADVQEHTQAPVDPEAASGRRREPRIRGYRCEIGHLNDPRSPSCRECGAPIDERVGGLVAGPRPVLGTLVFDDGAAHLVDGGYLVGRSPNVDERVRTGELRPIVVDDSTGSVSPAHAEIRVNGWDVMVVDNGSDNGTDVSGPDEGRWTALPPRRSRRLLPGTRVRLGARVFVFESTSAVR